jgi:fatty-acyl-CoA synthase
MLRDITHILGLHARTRPEVVALSVDGEPSLTYRDWDRRSTVAANDLRRLGAGPDRRVGLVFAGMDWVEYAVAYLAVLKAGATAVHLGAVLGVEEQVRRLSECAAVGLVHGADTGPPPGFAGWAVASADLSRDRDDTDTGGPDAGPGRAPDDAAEILYTSGTTGPAKAIVNPHALLMFHPPADGATVPQVLCPLPLGSSSSASAVTMAAAGTTGRPVVCATDDSERIAELIATTGVDRVMMTPWTAIRFAGSRAHERHDLSGLDRYLIASAPLPGGVARRLLAMADGAVINSIYTQSEAVPASVIHAWDPERPHALGRPAGATGVRVTDGSRRPVPAGTVGEIWLRAPGAGRRYLDARRNVDKYVDGWTRTGDLGRLDDDGVLHLFDRAEHVIMTAGGPVSSVAVEEVLYAHPAVREAAAVGVRGPDGHERVVAVVALDRPEAAGALRSWAGARLSPPQRPERVETVDALPRGITGKVLKRHLSARA